MAKVLIFHGSPYNFDEFNSLEHFDKECLLSYNGGMFGHYFYYVEPDVSEETINNIVIPEALRHACKNGTERGVVNTSGYIYAGIIGTKRFLPTQTKLVLDDYLQFFGDFYSEERIESIYNSCKNNKEILRRIINLLITEYSNDEVSKILSENTGYRGMIEPSFIGFSVLYCWDNTFITKAKLQKVRVHKKTFGSSIQNYQFQDL